VLSSTSVRLTTCRTSITCVLQVPAKDILKKEGAEVADVREGVNRGPAGVHANGVAFERLEIVDLASQRVVKAYGHLCESFRDPVKRAILWAASTPSQEKSSEAHGPVTGAKAEIQSATGVIPRVRRVKSRSLPPQGQALREWLHPGAPVSRRRFSLPNACCQLHTALRCPALRRDFPQ
jgi:hypothetical protein